MITRSADMQTAKHVLLLTVLSSLASACNAGTDVDAGFEARDSRLRS